MLTVAAAPAASGCRAARLAIKWMSRVVVVVVVVVYSFYIGVICETVTTEAYNTQMCTFDLYR